ncbi:MAG: alpha-amlyase [Verrucomicrobia bacterium Tous-C9LFEB]|nr:MAG: alpha-amlyase [Verrucomicrobia bacterium Tous-C9LFEB]
MNVILLWHMHQPYYVNPLTKTAMMPWVRLHSVKGYLDMIDLLERVPNVLVNFNFTPVLVKQIEELANGEVTDLWESWSRKPVEELHVDEKKRILEDFFKLNWDTMVKPYPRYLELLHRRGMTWSERTMDEAVKLFSAEDFRDLQVWYNLAWCGHSAVRRYPVLDELKKQGRDFTEEQKNAVLDIHREILKLVLSLYRDAVARGQVEITTTPFFHPIMPLVYDTDFARRCMPHATLPLRFSAPEDVRAQLRLAQEQHERVFGQKARGLWPSEGSIAPELIPLFQEAGIEYFCTDEGNLFHSLEHDPAWAGKHVDHLELFQGWRIRHDDAQVQALFRERPLSDFIGFNAARNEASRSVDYLMHHLDHLSSILTHPHQAVLLALDGENAWEAFADGGEKFLTLFYQALAERQNFRTRRLGGYFTEFPANVECTHLHTGSWINSDFDIWIGDPEENKGWEWIGQTRQFLVDRLANNDVPAETAMKAWWAIYAAEGSDWFWWYGPDFNTDCDFLFDELFRTHLQNVYRLLGVTPPAYLDVPICLPSQAVPYTLPHRYVQVGRKGQVENYFEWVGAGQFDIEQQQTAMYQSDRIGRQLYFGFNHEHFVLRLDASHRPEMLVVQFTTPSPCRLTIERGARTAYHAHLEQSEDQVTYHPVDTAIHAAWGEFLVVLVPKSALGWDKGGQISFFVQLMEKGLQKERYPERGAIEFPVPNAQFEASQWFV